MNLAYVPFKVENEQVGDAVKGAFALNILGMNVTVPHKQRVMEFLADIDQDARAIGAVNTLVRIEHGYKGYNTDAAGLTRALKELESLWRERSAFSLGQEELPRQLRMCWPKKELRPFHQRGHAPQCGRCDYRGPAFL